MAYHEMGAVSGPTEQNSFLSEMDCVQSMSITWSLLLKTYKHWKLMKACPNFIKRKHPKKGREKRSKGKGIHRTSVKEFQD
jgi:hypothetical protein